MDLLSLQSQCPFPLWCEWCGADSELSPPTAMRALGAVLIIVCLCESHAQISPRLLDTFLGNNLTVRRILTCARNLGPTKCLSALSSYRADRALKAISEKQNALFNLTEDVKHFDWKRYSNVTDDQLYSQLCDGTQRLLKHRSLFLNVQGYKFQLESNKNGALSVDVYKSKYFLIHL